MKRIIMLGLLVATLLTACSNTCKIDGCGKDVYKDGLCKSHYYAAEGANIINDLIGE